MADHTGNTNPGIIPESLERATDIREDAVAKIDFKTLVALLGIAVAGASGWFGIQAQFTATNARVDRLEEKVKSDKEDTDKQLAHLTKIVCAIAKKDGVVDLNDCE